MFDSNPSRQPIMRTVLRIISPTEVLLAAVVWTGVLAAITFGQQNAAKPAPANANGPAEANAPVKPNDAAEAERQAVWNSPPMVAARAWLEEYFRTSRRSPPEVEQAYLDHLSRLSAEQMRDWLQQMGTMRSRTAQQQRRTDYVRSQDFQQAQRQAATNTLAQSGRARARYATPEINFVQPTAARRAAEAAALSNRYAPLRSVQLLWILDTIDIRNDLRDLRNSRQN